MAKLNGWQRLWVVVTVLWTVGGLSISYATWPSPSDYLRTLEAGGLDTTMTEAEFRRAYNDVLAEEIRRDPGQSQGDDPFAPFYVQPSDVDDPFAKWRVFPLDDGTEGASEELRIRRQRQWLRTISQIRLDPERQALRDDRVEHVQITLMSWAIPLAVLYAFGWSAGWIRRGFRG